MPSSASSSSVSLDEPALDEDLADAAAVAAVPRAADPAAPRPGPDDRVRPVGLLELGPLLGEHAGELDARDVELGDEDLPEQLPALGLKLERTVELLLGQKPTLDEEGADQTRLKDRCVTHATCIGNPSFGL